MKQSKFSMILKVPVLLLIITLLSISLPGCKPKSDETADKKPAVPKMKLEGQVLFVIGDVKIGDKQLKTGDIIPEKLIIQTGKKSICDLKLMGMQSSVNIRIHENSKFHLDQQVKDEMNKAQLKLQAGKALVYMQRLKLMKESMETHTPTAVAAVRGTKYELTVQDDSSTNITVIEGKVAAKVSIKEINDLPPDVKEKSEAIQKLDKYLQEKEVMVESGKSADIPKDTSDKILEMTGLGEIIETTEYSKLTEELDSKVSSKSLEESLAKLEEKNLQPKLTSVPQEILDEKAAEFNELTLTEEEKTNLYKDKEEEENKKHHKKKHHKKRHSEEKGEWSGYLGQMNWNDAKKKCDSRGMRLPTKAELIAAYKSGKTESWKKAGDWYWSSTLKDDDNAYLLRVSDGNVDYHIRNFNGHVRCRH